MSQLRLIKWSPETIEFAKKSFRKKNGTVIWNHLEESTKLIALDDYKEWIKEFNNFLALCQAGFKSIRVWCGSCEELGIRCPLVYRRPVWKTISRQQQIEAILRADTELNSREYRGIIRTPVRRIIQHVLPRPNLLHRLKLELWLWDSAVRKCLNKWCEQEDVFKQVVMPLLQVRSTRLISIGRHRQADNRFNRLLNAK